MKNSIELKRMTLEDLYGKDEIKFTLEIIETLLSKNAITAIENALIKNILILESGIVYFKIRGLATILRCSNGAERFFVYQGISGILPISEIIEIDGNEYISSPSLVALFEYRKLTLKGKTKSYLNISARRFNDILASPKINELREIWLEKVEDGRKGLKKERIDYYNITECEFSGKKFSSIMDVEFAHKESVITSIYNPYNMSKNDGVIILKEIHKEITRQNIHRIDELIDFCKENNYNLDWLDK